MTDKMQRAIEFVARILRNKSYPETADDLLKQLAAEPDDSARWAAADKLAERLANAMSIRIDHDPHCTCDICCADRSAIKVYNALKPPPAESPDDMVGVKCSSCGRLNQIKRSELGGWECGTYRPGTDTFVMCGVFEEVKP